MAAGSLRELRLTRGGQEGRIGGTCLLRLQAGQGVALFCAPAQQRAGQRSAARETQVRQDRDACPPPRSEFS